MKKFFVMVCALTFIVGVTNTASALNAGSWSLATGLENGAWAEFGKPDRSDNMLFAWSGDFQNPTGQWALNSLKLLNFQIDPTGTWDLIVNYGGPTSSMVLNDPSGSLWGESITVTGVTAVNRQKAIYDGSGNVTGGDFAMAITGSYDGLDIIINAGFSGILGVNYFPLLGPDQTIVGMGGVGFKNIELVITPEPSTIILLGVGMLGLAALGRKQFSQK